MDRFECTDKGMELASDGDWLHYADAQAQIEALQTVIRQMGEQAAVLAKDGMAAKGKVEALQRERDGERGAKDALIAEWVVLQELLEKAGLNEGEGGLMDQVRSALAALDAERKKVANTEKAYQEKARLWIEQTGALAQLQALVRALPVLHAPIVVCLNGNWTVKSTDSPLKYSYIFESQQTAVAVCKLLRYRATLGATTPAEGQD